MGTWKPKKPVKKDWENFNKIKYEILTAALWIQNNLKTASYTNMKNAQNKLAYWEKKQKEFNRNFGIKTYIDYGNGNKQRIQTKTNRRSNKGCISCGTGLLFS